MSKVTYDDMMELVNEIERGAKDKTRTLNSVTNVMVKDMLVSEVSLERNRGIKGNAIGYAGGALAGAVGCIGEGATATGLSTMAGPAFGIAAGTTTGAATGSVVPIVGTAVGAVVGASVGYFVGSRVKKKNEREQELFNQEVIKKQNTYIRDLEKELEEIIDIYEETAEENERYKYILSLLRANEKLRRAA